MIPHNSNVPCGFVTSKCFAATTHCRTTGIGSEDQTQSEALHFSSCNDLGGEDLKQQPLCQDSPKDVLSDSGLEIELAIPFVPNRDPPRYSSTIRAQVRSCIIIHQNEVVTNSSSIWGGHMDQGSHPDI
ncbi:hypothetical protein TNCV_2023701 [Trichonephila clavipes]|nr:hypothetical protein TNCV_2023701 [Trichonephila clavipes]